MAEKQGRPIPKLFGGEFYARCPCVVSWHTSEDESMLQVTLSQPQAVLSTADVQVTASKPPTDVIRVGIEKLEELNGSIKTLTVGGDASVREKLPPELLDALLQAVAALNASLGPPMQRGRRRPPQAPTSSPMNSPLEMGEPMLFDIDV